MRRLLRMLALSVILAVLLSGSAEARRLLRDGAIEAHVADGEWCAERVYVELRTPVRESFAGDAFQVRRAVAILGSLLPLECPQAREIELVGSVGGAAVWRAAAGVASGELDVLSPPDSGDLVPLDERQRTSEIQSTLNRLGFDAGPPDGVAGPRTRAAIRAWRASRGLSGGETPSVDVLLAMRREQGVASPAERWPDDPGQSLFEGEGSSEPPGGTGQRTPPSEPATSQKLQDYAASNDLVLVNGRVALSAGYWAPQRIKQSEPAGLLDRLALRAAPEITANANTAFAYLSLLPRELRRSMISGAMSAMTERQRKNLEHRGWSLSAGDARKLGMNEFEFQRLLQSYRSEGQPRLIAEAPELPLSVLIVCGGQLGNYDFERRRFSLEHSCADVNTESQRVRAKLLLNGAPTHVEKTPEEAEGLRRRLERGSRIYAAVEASIVGVAPQHGRENSFDLTLSPKTLILYEDEELQVELLRVALAEKSEQPVADGPSIDPRRLIVDSDRHSTGDQKELLQRHLAFLALAAAPRILDDDDSAYAYMERLNSEQKRQLAQQSGVEFDTIFEEVGKVGERARRNLDEFSRRRLLASFREDYSAQLIDMSPALPLPMLLYCDVELDEYDFERSLYPFARSLDRACGQITRFGAVVSARAFPWQGLLPV